MPVRNGLLSTLRAKGRTALFVLLILVLTVALALGLGLWAYCGSLLAQMDEQYTSVALVEYMGENYPDENAADEDARAALEALDGEAISAVDGVTLWEPARSTLVSIDGYQRPGGNSPYRNYGVVVGRMTPEYVEGSAPVDEADLAESRAVYKYMSDGSVLEFVLPGLEPLELPYYFYSNEDGVYYREGTMEDVDRESITAGVIKKIGYYWGSPQVEYEWIGVPEDYDTEVLAQLLETAFYEYYLLFAPMANGEDAGTDGSQYIYISYNVPMLGECYGRVSKALYTAEGKDEIVCYFLQGDTDFIPVEGQKYLLHGEFDSSMGVSRFRLMPFPDSDDDPWLEVSGDDDPAVTESIFAEYAERYRASNNSATLVASDSISSLEPFQQGTLYLTDGRFPQAGEAGVCLLSGSMAEYLEVGVGDTLNLQILDSSQHRRADVYLTGDFRTLEIVGVTNKQNDYKDLVWTSGAEDGFSAPLFGYTLGVATLDNAKAVQAAEALSALLPPLARLTLYDQGYAAAARPIQAMRGAAQAITLASACGALAVLVLFAFLFVGRQRETVGVLVSLGTPTGKIRLWLLSGAAAISGAAALLGAVIGTLTLGRVTAAAMAMAERLYATDTRYSEAANGLIKESMTADTVPGWPAPVAGAAVFLAALALCLAFLRHARKENAPKQGKVSVRVPRGHTSTGGSGALRFAALSARRGGRRSVVVVAAALVLTLFVSLLAAGAQSWSRQLEDLYENSELEGQIVSLNGRKQTGLTIPMQDIQALWKSGLLEDIAVSVSWSYSTLDEAPPPTGTTGDTLENWMAARPKLSAVSSLSAAGEFYYTDRPEIQWLDGWDESFLRDPAYTSIMEEFFSSWGAMASSSDEVSCWPVLAGTRFMEAHGLELGDKIGLWLPVEFVTDLGMVRTTYTINVQVVGTFVSSGAKDNLYAPITMWCGLEWLHGDGDAELGEWESGPIKDDAARERRNYWRTQFETCRFTLRSAYELEDLRGWLAEQGYSQVGRANRNRITILLRDESFVDTVGGLGRYISFSRILFPVLFLVVGLLGFIISWLTVSSRRMEIAVMRGLGASPGRAFASFFLEQAALCLTGCLAGVLVMTLLYPGGAVWLAGAGFLACYLVGCALSVLTAGRTNLMLLLSERE